MLLRLVFKNALRLLALWAFVTWNVVASLDDDAQRQLDDVIQSGMTCKQLPGLSLAIVKDGKVLFSKGYGVKDTDSQKPVTSDTLFQIASLTKAFSSALLCHILADNQSLKLSTALHSGHLLPASFQFNDTLRTTYATLEDLLAHRTGIPRNNYIRLSNDYNINTTIDKLRYLPSVGSFRDSFYYNDLMYGVVAHVTEALGNKPWQQQVRETIFNPLGMSHSTFISDVDFDHYDVAAPYVFESWQSDRLVKASTEFIKHWGRNSGSGAIFSSANDMAKWMLLLLNDGADGLGRQVLKEGVLQQVFKPSNVIPPPSYAASYRRPVVPETFSGDTYGLGWRLGYYREYQMAYHSGSTFGYRSFLTLLPELNVGVVSLMTGIDDDYKFRTALHEYLMDLTLGVVPWINSTSICTFPEPWKSAYSSPLLFDQGVVSENSDEFTVRRQHREAPLDIDLESFTGVYRHEAYGDVEVRFNTSTRVLELQYGIGLWHLDTTDGKLFQGHWAKDHPHLDMDFFFHNDGQHIVSLEVHDFEPSKPPTFYRRAKGSSGFPVG